MHLFITIAVLVATISFFAWGKIRSDMVALYALLCLSVTSVLTPQEALSGFSSNVIFITAGMFVLSGAIVRSGLASVVSSKLLGVAGNSAKTLFMLVMVLAALIGSMVSNTGTVAIMMPIVVSMALKIDESPSRFLMPLAYMSSIGGMFTLVGNSPNMVANDAYVKADYPSLSFFSFLPIGVACLVFGVFVLSPATFYLLSRRKNEKDGFGDSGRTISDLLKSHKLTPNIYQAVVSDDSPLVGRRLSELCLTAKNHVTVQEICRFERVNGLFGTHVRETQIIPDSQTILKTGDLLRLLGTHVNVRSLADECRSVLSAPGSSKWENVQRLSALGVCELVIMSSSQLVNRSVADSGLREQYGITVLSIHRGDVYIFENIRDQVVLPGDALLVQGSWERLARLEENYTNWVVVGRPQDMAASGKLYHKIPLVATVVVLMVGAMAFNLLPTVVAVLLAAMVLVSGGCFKNMREVYTVISWDVLVMIASMFSIALAMEKTGIVEAVSAEMIWVGKTFGPSIALAVTYFVASFMNILISTTPVALLISPVAVQVAVDLGYSPLPFVFAVATAASMCFASPFSAPPNALVMSAGRYTFADYVKIGLPMQVLMGVAMVFVIPVLFPFVPAGG